MRQSALTTIALMVSFLGTAIAQEDGPILSNPVAQTFYDNEWGFAEAYRSGDYIHLSGKIIASPDGRKLSIEEFKQETEKTFQSIDAALKAGGSSLDDVVMIRSYHVFDSAYLEASKMQQMLAFQEIKKKLVAKPHPAQSSVGVSELIVDSGIVEVEVVAYSPKNID